jgi:hypothetical protein
MRKNEIRQSFIPSLLKGRFAFDALTSQISSDNARSDKNNFIL